MIDCHNHEAVVPFWQAALGWERQEVNAQYVAVIPPPDELEAAGPRPLPMLFQKVPEPKIGKNRMRGGSLGPGAAAWVPGVYPLSETA